MAAFAMIGGFELLFVLAIIFLLVAANVAFVLTVLYVFRSFQKKKATNQSPAKAGAHATCPRCGSQLPTGSPQDLCPRCVLEVGLATQTETGDEFGPSGTKVTKPAPAPEDIAARFSQLEIQECLGRGGMGVVYRARHPKLNRLVALKILAPEKGGDPKFSERFSREARMLARLNHPNIVTVYDFGEADGMFYLLMEHVDGTNLRQLIRERRLRPEEALAIVPKICEALQYAHELGVVHRDIKPENVLLDKEGRVKIADFGIAKMVGEEAGPVGLTQDQVIGTPHYMAPEQVERPKIVDHRADIYSLGVVFYEMLTGELPLGKFAPPSTKVQVDVRLDQVVLRTLEKEPERRYQHASEVKTDVETIASTATNSFAGVSASSIAQHPGNTHSDQLRKALLQYGFVACLIGLPVGLVLGLPFVWGLSLAGLVISAIKLGLPGTQITRRNSLRAWPERTPLSVLEFWAAMNRGNYAQAWEAAAPMFQRTISKEEWVNQMEEVRRPLGKATSHKLRSMNCTADSSVLDAVYDSTFEESVEVVEFVSFAAQPNGEYKIISYHLELRSAENASSNTFSLPQVSKWVAAARWTARILGTVLLLFFALFMVAEGLPPIAVQPGGVQLNFVALGVMITGFAVGWKKEGAAALLIASGWTIWHASEGRFGWNVFQVPLLVAGLYAYYWWETRGRKTGVLVGTAGGLAVALMVGLLLLPANVFIQGQVIDASSGSPITNASLMFTKSGANAHDVGVRPNTRADKDGRFRLYVGWYGSGKEIAITAPGYETLATNLGPRDIGQRQVFRDFQLTISAESTAAVETGVTSRQFSPVPDSSSTADLGDVPPVVVATVPSSGASDVDPFLSELRVTFSERMQDDSWSWCKLDDKTFPEMTGQSRYLDDGRTCVLPVKLLPGRTYATWINADESQNFKDQGGQPAVPYLLIFKTSENPVEALSEVLVGTNAAAQFNSIQRAIDAVADGGIVRIGGGRYPERLEINKPVRLIGAGWEETVIGPTNAWSAPSPDEMREMEERFHAVTSDAERARLREEFSRQLSPPVLFIQGADGVSVEGLRFTQPGVAPEGKLLNGAVIEVNSSVMTLKNCAIVGSPNSGVILNAGSVGRIDDSLIAALWNRGISIVNGSKAEIRNCEIRNCHYAGVTISRGADAVVEGCRISGAAWHGIRYDDASPRIENNLIFRNARSGIYASGSTKALIRRNAFFRNEMNGISCWFDNQDVIEANTFLDNKREALSVLGSSAPTIQSNIFHGHPVALYQGRISGDQDSVSLGQPVLLRNAFWNNETNWIRATATDTEGKPVPEVLELSAESRSEVEDLPSALQQGLGAPISVWADSPWPLQPEESAIIPEGDTRDSTKWKRRDQ